MLHPLDAFCLDGFLKAGPASGVVPCWCNHFRLPLFICSASGQWARIGVADRYRCLIVHRARMCCVQHVILSAVQTDGSYLGLAIERYLTLTRVYQPVQKLLSEDD